MGAPFLRTDSGYILVDILLALSLGVLFVAVLGQSSAGARELFDRARERNALLDAYETYEAGGTATSTVAVSSATRPYGNDRTEQDISVSSVASTTYSAYKQSVGFVTVSSSFSNMALAAGTPLCSVDFSHASNSALAQTATIVPISLPIPPTLPLTDMVVRDGIAYVSTDSTVATDADIYIVDIHDSIHARIRASLNTGPGIAAITLAGNHIFAAAASTAAELHSIRLISLDSLSLDAKYALSLPYATATPPFGTSIFYDKGRVYLGTEKWDGAEFNIIDIANPASPTLLGSFETGSKVGDIYVRSGSAYVAASDMLQLRSLDVSNPATPVLQNSMSPSGFTRQEGNSLGFFEGQLGFGRTSGGFDIPADLEGFIFATSSSQNLSVTHAINIPGGIYGMVFDRDHIYLASRQVGHELEVFDRNFATSSARYFPLPTLPGRLTCDGSHLYVLSHSSPTIYDITF